MEKYLKGKSKEIKLLSQYLKKMEYNPELSTIQFDFPNTDCDLLTLTTDDEMEYIVCFAFNVLDTMPDYLKNLESYLKTRKTDSSEWFTTKSAFFDSLKAKVRQYTDFVKANSGSKQVTFVVTDHCDDVTSGPAIMLYHDDTCTEFEPPGKPGTPTVVQNHRQSIVLTWTKNQIVVLPLPVISLRRRSTMPIYSNQGF